MSEAPLEPEEERALMQRLRELKGEHRVLDEQISLLDSGPSVDQITLRRMKKRKLFLRDEIEQIRSRLIPDLNA